MNIRKVYRWLNRSVGYLIGAFVLLVMPFGISGQVLTGTKGYVEYHRGTLPVVISAPHGGSLTPADIPDRTCLTPTTATDRNTIQLALQIDSSFFRLTGCHIHLVICNLKRTKLDCNRELEQAACGNPDAVKAWTEFHHFIDTAVQLSKSEYSNLFYIDLHGHGHVKPRLELGYGLTGTVLRESDLNLNLPPRIALSSIQNLVKTNVHAYSHAELIRGPYALGTLLGNLGYPAVPSEQIPSPDATDEFYSGGYNTQVHTSFSAGSSVNGVQIECNYAGVRDSYQNRRAFADALARALLEYLEHHQDITPHSCGSGIPDLPAVKAPVMFPSLITPGQQVFFRGMDLNGADYRIFSYQGKMVQSAKIGGNNSILFDVNHGNGLFLVEVRKGMWRHTFRLLVN